MLKLALRELRCTTRAFETVLLTFLHTWVTCEETCGFERRTEVRVYLKQGTGNAVADCAGLASVAAAVDVNENVVAAESFSRYKRLLDDFTECFEWDVIFCVTAVDYDFTFAGYEAYAGNGSLAAASADVLNLCQSGSSS